MGSSAGSEKVVRVGLTGALTTLDPRRARDYVSGFVLEQIFDTPYVWKDGAAVPVLFEPLRAEDGTAFREYSTQVRAGVALSDGTPLTNEIAARSLQRAQVLDGVARVAIRGERIWFSLSVPDSRFALTLSQSGCAIVHETAARLLGTGPYVLEDGLTERTVAQAERLRLTRNARHTQAASAADVEFHVLRPEQDGTPRSLVEALRSGAIDLTTALSASDLMTWQLTGAAPVVRPANSTALLFMNCERPQLSNVRAREAIASAIDVLEVASRCYDRNPAAFVATSVLPPAMARSTGLPRIGAAEGARNIESAGLRGASLTLLVPWTARPYLPRPHAVAETLRTRLEAAGLRIALLEPKSGDDYFQQLTQGRFDLALGGWIAETADPSDFFEAILASHFVGHDTFANCSRWKDSATDVLLSRYRLDPTDANRAALERVISESLPFLPLVYGQSSAVHTRRVRNVNVTASGTIALSDVRVIA